MGLVWMCGFEWGTKMELTTADSGTSISSSIKRGGSYSFHYGNGQNGYKSLPVGYQELFCQFAFYWAPTTGDVPVVTLYNGSNDIFSIQRNASNLLEVRVGYAGGSTYITGVTPIQSETWYVVELHYIIDAVNGFLELRLDGNIEGTFIGNTRPKAYDTIDKFRFGHGTGTGGANVDDIVIFDPTGSVNNSWPNGLKVALIRPIGDAGPNEWTPSESGDHYTKVDEVPPDNADWLKGMTEGDIEQLDLEQLPAEALTVKAVQADFWGVKGAVLPPDRLKIGFNIGGTSHMSDEMNLLLAQAQMSWLCDQNPAGGNWTAETVNNLYLVMEARGA